MWIEPHPRSDGPKREYRPMNIIHAIYTAIVHYLQIYASLSNLAFEANDLNQLGAVKPCDVKIPSSISIHKSSPAPREYVQNNTESHYRKKNWCAHLANLIIKKAIPLILTSCKCAAARLAKY